MPSGEAPQACPAFGAHTTVTLSFLYVYPYIPGMKNFPSFFIMTRMDFASVMYSGHHDIEQGATEKNHSLAIFSVQYLKYYVLSVHSISGAVIGRKRAIDCTY